MAQSNVEKTQVYRREVTEREGWKKMGLKEDRL